MATSKKRTRTTAPTTTDAPTDDVTALLAEKRKELRRVELEEARAVEHYQTAEAAEAGKRVEVLKGFVQRLEAQAAVQRDRDVAQEAARWLHDHPLRGNPEHRRALHERIDGAVTELVEALAAERARLEAERAVRTSMHLLYLRYPELQNGGAPAPEPLLLLTYKRDAVDQAYAELLRVREALRQGPRLEKYGLAGKASDSPEQRRQQAVAAVGRWAEKHGETLPAEVRAILSGEHG